MIIKHLSALNKYSFWVAASWTFLILYLSFKSASGLPKVNFPNIDKIVHFMFYFVFVVLWSYHFFKNKQAKLIHLTLLFLGTVFLGILVEIGQGKFTISRHSDVLDVVANSSGAFLGMVLFYRIFSIQKNKK